MSIITIVVSSSSSLGFGFCCPHRPEAKIAVRTHAAPKSTLECADVKAYFLKQALLNARHCSTVTASFFKQALLSVQMSKHAF
eukprot:1160814-Pelagomonas_calceolata.AAC.2